ncbi:MAG: NTP transferase domain-containing protein [Candidatus Paceibacterota bacterium]
MNNIKIVILAGGKGKRMLSELPKALIPLKGKAMINYVLDSIKEISNQKPIVIVGHKADLIELALGDTCEYALQPEPLGTGHAVSFAEKNCEDAKYVLVLSSDQPLISSKTINDLIKKHVDSKAVITLTTTVVDNFNEWRNSFIAFGRILRDNNEVVGIKEYRDATEEEKNIKEVNAGCYMFDAKWLWQNLKKIKNQNAQNEYYLTDLFKIAGEDKEKIESITIEAHEALGANTKEELERLEKFVV